MRCTALAALLAATGCNWVFGLDPTVTEDSGSGSEQPIGARSRLVWAIATTDGDPPPPALTDPVLEYVPIGSEDRFPERPIIQVGDEKGLVEVDYDISDGSFEIPYPVNLSAHRIAYMLPGESVPTEIQWALTDATLVVPRTTRANAPKPPTQSGYTVTPSGLVGSTSAPVAYTSGVFTFSDAPSAFVSSMGSVTFRYAENAKPLAGPSGAPLAGKGDWVLIGDLRARANQMTSLGGWTLFRVDLVEGTMAMPPMQPAWNTEVNTFTTITPCLNYCLPSGNTGSVLQRIDNVLGALVDPEQPETYGFAFGSSPSTELPAFVPGTAPEYLPKPLMLPFAMGAQILSSFQVTDPSLALGLPRVLFARVARTRIVDGVKLTSAIQTVTTVFQGTLQYPAPLVQNIRLGEVSLSGDQPDGVPVPASSGPVAMTFEQESGYSADDFVITLYEITGASLAPVRHYQVIQPSVQIDGNLLVPSHKYVFGITSRSGFGAADRGDYRKAQYPFGVSTTFTRTFVVQ